MTAYHPLFVYGTLREQTIQQHVFGRTVEGVPDRLGDYRRTSIRINRTVYPAAVPKTGQTVDGLVLLITEEELRKADRYETKMYDRLLVKLASGTEAFIYVLNPAERAKRQRK